MGCNASSNGLSSPGASSSNSSSHMWASPAGQPDSNSGSSSAAPALRPGRRALLAATANAAGAGSESCSSPAASSTHAVEPSGLMGRSGRRTMSAQGVLRTGPPPRAVTSAVSPASSGRGAADAPGQGPVAAPKSPPWPRSVTDVRAQSGPARLSAEALQVYLLEGRMAACCCWF